jgi:hypothetical protein
MVIGRGNSRCVIDQVKKARKRQDTEYSGGEQGKLIDLRIDAILNAVRK